MNIKEISDLGNTISALPADDPNHYVDQAGGLFPPSRYYLFFKHLAARCKFKNMVVLGVCGGGDCYHLAKGNPEGDVIGVDIAYDHPEQIKYIMDNCPRFRFWEGDSVGSAPDVFSNFGPIDFLFIDTTHTADATSLEWLSWKRYLAPGAIVCFDDLYRTEMKGVWEALPEPKVRLDLLHDGSPDVGGGFGVLINE